MKTVKPLWMEPAYEAINRFMSWKSTVITAGADALGEEVPDLWTEGDAYLVQDLSEKSTKQVIDMFQRVAKGNMIANDVTTNPFCIVHNYMRLLKTDRKTVDPNRCTYCEYGKAHGICLADDSDEFGIIMAYPSTSAIVGGIISKKMVKIVMKKRFSKIAFEQEVI